MIFTLANQGVFRTLQGEGALLGTPMIFVRFAGCSIGCKECDTNYEKKESVTLNELIQRIINLQNHLNDFVWLTGGEPTDQKYIHDLTKELKLLNMPVAIATAGMKVLPNGLYDWISVSPHIIQGLIQNYGDELKIVPKLNGFKLSDLNYLYTCKFKYKFIQPLEGENPKEYIDFVLNNSGWRLTIQAHKIWNIQ